MNTIKRYIDCKSGWQSRVCTTNKQLHKLQAPSHCQRTTSPTVPTVEIPLQSAQQEQGAAWKAQQEQVVKETLNQIQGEEDLFEAEDRVSLASEVENGQARTETLADTSHIQNHSYIETVQARTGNLAESGLLEDGKSLSLAPRDEKNEANTASLSKLVRLEPLSAEEIEKQKDVKTAQTSGSPKSQSILPILHVFDKSHLADIGEEEDNNVSDTESIMSGVDDQPHIEERGNNVGGQSQKEPLPKEVYEIRSRMGGRDGPLFALIDAKLQGKDDDAAANLLKSLAGEVETFCDAKGISRATYALTDTHIDAFYGMVKEVNGFLVLLKANLNDTNAQHHYKQLRSRADLFVQEHQWPETFLDTFVPTEAEISKWVNDEIKRDAAQKAQREQEAAQKAQREIEAARNSKLQTDLLDTGQENHQAHSSNIQERAERPALSNYTTQDNYITEGNAEDPESDKAQTEVEGQPARSTFEPQSRQSDPVAKDRETAQTVTELVEPDVSDEKRALFISKGQKRSFGEMKKGGGLGAWNYGGGGGRQGAKNEAITQRAENEASTVGFGDASLAFAVFVLVFVAFGLFSGGLPHRQLSLFDGTWWKGDKRYS